MDAMAEPAAEGEQGRQAELSLAEQLQAINELKDHTIGYIKSMALGCAAKLGIADAIHRGGGQVSLEDLLTYLSLPKGRLPYLRRLMRVLTTSGLFAQVDAGAYRLTPVSSLLVSTEAGNPNHKNLTPLVIAELSPFIVLPSLNMAEWLKGHEDSAFKMTHGTDLWGFCDHRMESGKLFNEAMASESKAVMDVVIQTAGQVFQGINTLVDVGGGTGEAAKAVAMAFPQIRCKVLDLPRVIHGVSADDLVEFVPGDMMDFIPPADALLLKFVLHDWSDEDCINILKRCREAKQEER